MSDPGDPDIIDHSPRELPRELRRFRIGLTPRRGPLLLASAAVAAIAVAASAALVLAAGPAPAPPNPDLAAAMSVPAGSSDGTPDTMPEAFVSPVAEAALTAAGKPEVFYIGAQFCPYCAVQDWALLVALSRFGTFSGVTESRSAHYDGIPPIDTWTFHGSAYRSAYLSFVPVETESSIPRTGNASPNAAGGFRPLQRLTAAQRSIYDKYDPARSTPFIDFAGKDVLIGSLFEPRLLVGRTWHQIAVALRHPAGPAGAAILGAADYLTAEFCSLTRNKPASACPAFIRKFYFYSGNADSGSEGVFIPTWSSANTATATITITAAPSPLTKSPASRAERKRAGVGAT